MKLFFVDFFDVSVDFSIPLVKEDSLEGLKATARPFYDWLQEAEEDISDDDVDEA